MKSLIASVFGILIFPAIAGNMLPDQNDQNSIEFKPSKETEGIPAQPVERSVGWVGTPEEMKSSCESQIERQFGRRAIISSEGALRIDEFQGSYILSGSISNADNFADINCVSKSRGEYLITPLKSNDQSGLDRIRNVANPETILNKLISLGENPEQNVIETNNDNGRHYYSWDRPDLGASVGGVWYGKGEWWIQIRQPNFSRNDLKSRMEAIKSNGVATTYRISDGPLKGGYYIESDTQTNIYSNNPRWDEINSN